MLDRTKLEKVWKEVTNDELNSLNSLEKVQHLGLNPEEADALIERARIQELWTLAFARAALDMMRSRIEGHIDRETLDGARNILRRFLDCAFEQSCKEEGDYRSYYEAALKKIKAAAE